MKVPVFLVAVVAVCYSSLAAGGERTVAYRGGHWWNGKAFVERTVYVVGNTIGEHGSDRVDREIDLSGGYVIPPLGDAHTHHFDSPHMLPAQRRAYLEAGVFYAMTMTAPSKYAEAIRDDLSGPTNVDVVTSLGGITGPGSHPAEIYEALALGIYDYLEQAARAEEIRASRRAADNAYFVVENPDDVDEKLQLALSYEPDFVKIYLRKSERYDDGYGKWGPGGGIDPKLLPQIAHIAGDHGLRLAVAASSVADFRAALDSGADVITHLPCYQDSASDPDSPYYHVHTAEECLLSAEDAARAAETRMATVLICSEWAKHRPDRYVAWEMHNISLLEENGAPLAVGSNAYGSTVIDGLVAGVEKGFFEPVRILQLATRETARMIFPERRVGCLESGCEASFLVLDDDPLEDFSAIRRIRLRVKEGRHLDDARLGGPLPR